MAQDGRKGIKPGLQFVDKQEPKGRDMPSIWRRGAVTAAHSIAPGLGNRVPNSPSLTVQRTLHSDHLPGICISFILQPRLHSKPPVISQGRRRGGRLRQIEREALLHFYSLA
ncbi:hypothetical protein SKAU_G00374020 [Synaphobranchus kaupii]|uniref:Uncharacterized protein n=1 Tax=Synaphobranchus kaupii TaxID=118154 RepID=A0A9Q1EGK8_SYNKA|nr:hypothetical protein SKAU_G00374020 [Synaphobranchus kaupii]